MSPQYLVQLPREVGENAQLEKHLDLQESQEEVKECLQRRYLY